jgi:hypothetical protein
MKFKKIWKNDWVGFFTKKFSSEIEAISKTHTEIFELQNTPGDTQNVMGLENVRG